MNRDLPGRLLGAWLGITLSILAVVVLAGWHLSLFLLLQISPLWPPMQYNTAVCFLAMGAGLFLLATGRRWASWASAIPLAVGGITLVTWILDLHPGIDSLLFKDTITVASLHPGRMSPNTALGFVLAGLGMALATSQSCPRCVVSAWMIGLVVILGGAAAGAWTIVVADAAQHAPVRFTYMAVHSALAFIAAGVAIVALTMHGRNAVPRLDRVWELPIAAGTASLVSAFVLWQAFTVADDERVYAGTVNAAEQIASAIESDSVEWLEALESSGSRITRVADPEDAAWEQDAREYFGGAPWLREIAWYTTDGAVRNRVRRDSTGTASGGYELEGPQHTPEFRDAVANQVVRIHPASAHPSGNPYSAYVFFPLASPATAGLLSFTIRLDEWFDQAIGPLGSGYDIRITGQGRLVLLRDQPTLPEVSPDHGAASRTLTLLGTPWLLEVRPRVGTLEQTASVLPGVTLLFGVTLSLLMMVALRYAAEARHKAASIVRTGHLLEREVEERRRAEVYARTSEERAHRALADVQQILNQSRDLICTVDRDGRFVVVSASSKQILGYRPDEMVGRHWSEFADQEESDETLQVMTAIRGGQSFRDYENRFVHRDGTLVELSWSSTWLEESGTIYSIARDVTRRNQQLFIRDTQRHILNLIATGVPLRTVLHAICVGIEKISPRSLCSVLLLDADGQHLWPGAATSLPAAYIEALAGLRVGPSVGSCGTAVWTKSRVIVEDIDRDPLWDDFRELARQHGLRACWSIPVMGEREEVLGTFAIYHRVPCRPSHHELEFIEAAAGLATIAIERDRDQARLLDSNQQLEFARRLAQLGYWEVVDNGKVVLSNDMLDRLKLPRDSHHSFNDLIVHVVEEDRPALTAARDGAIRHDQPIDTHIRLQIPEGGVRYVHFLGRGVRRGDGHVFKVAGTVQDVTPRKEAELENARLYAELEERVRIRTRELEQSNRELEAFSYSVSHDLRAPLRAISGFSSLLQERYSSAIDESGQHYLRRIVAGTERMSALIDDLLELSRVSRIDLVRQPLDLSGLAGTVAMRLRERWPQRVVECEIEADMVIWGDPRLMEVAVENLLQNAWKFSVNQPVARIRMGSLSSEGQKTYFVEDNGVGFDPQYAANLFGVFQRLHAASAFPGTGVGLATVHRILQRHGGRIWAQSKVNEGATFYFTVSGSNQ